MITVVDYGAGNVTSVLRALAHIGHTGRISADPDEVARADRVLFPGVGHAATAMGNLRARGMDAALKEVAARGTPLMGICLGSQVLLSHSEEGDVPCLDLLAGTVQKLAPGGRNKVPHMGWNPVEFCRDHPLLAGLKSQTQFYFVHSYFTQPRSAQHTIGQCSYGEATFPVIIGKDNLFATQFHPEKSGEAGLLMLANFATWEGTPC